MERWLGKTAVVTGASAGIGAAIAIDLANAGLKVIALARRKERLESLQKSLSADCKGAIIAHQCDVTSEAEIKTAFAWIETNFGGVNILVNNAGVLRNTLLLAKDNSKDIRDQVDTNVLAVVWCTREAFHSMKNRGFDGHIVNINSTSGHSLPWMVGILDLNVYPATKYAVTALTEVLRQELIQHKTKIKITSVSPGNVLTEIYTSTPEVSDKIKDEPYLEPKDVSQAVLYAIGTPPHVQIHEIIIKPVGESI